MMYAFRLISIPAFSFTEFVTLQSKMFKSLQRQAARKIRSRPCHALPPCRAYAAPASEPFDWKDPLRAANSFTEEEVQIAETAEAYCQEQMAPRVLGP